MHMFMRRVAVAAGSGLVGVTLSAAIAAPTFAAPNPSGTGQPSQSCGSTTAPQTPGNATTSPGSAFNPNGVADQHYAGQQPQNSKNPKSVSQYDVACYQVSQRR